MARPKNPTAAMNISIHAPREGCDSMVKIFRFYRVRQVHFREGQKSLPNHREKSPISLL